MKIQAIYIGNSSFFKKGESYNLILIEEIRPKALEKILFHLEIENELPFDPEESVKMTYFGILPLLRSWKDITKRD